MEEPLIRIDTPTSFEKLLFAQHEIKELKEIIKSLQFEIGLLKSDLDLVKHENDTVAKVINQRTELRALREKCKRLNRRNSELILEINKLTHLI